MLQSQYIAMDTFSGYVILVFIRQVIIRTGQFISPAGISKFSTTVRGMMGGEVVNQGGDTPSFCPTSKVLDADEAGINSVMKFLPHTLEHLRVNRSDCLHDPLSQMLYIMWHRRYIHMILDVTPLGKKITGGLD
jgi:hypothetical protein